MRIMRKYFLIAGLTILITLPLGAEQPAQPPNTQPPTAPTMFTPLAASADSSTNAPAPDTRPAPFTAEMSAEFMRKVMETSAKIEALKKQMADRRAELFASHTEIKGLRAEMLVLQNKINTILAADQKLAEMEIERDILWTTMPPMPGAIGRPGVANPPFGMFPMMGK